MLIDYITALVEQHSAVELGLAGTVGLFIGTKLFGPKNYKFVFIKSILHEIYLVCTDPIEEEE